MCTPWTISTAKPCPILKLSLEETKQIFNHLPGGGARGEDRKACANVCKLWQFACLLGTDMEPLYRAPLLSQSRKRADEKAKHAKKIWSGTKAKRGLSEFQVKKLQRASTRAFASFTSSSN